MEARSAVGRTRRTSSGRCASCCPMPRACVRAWLIRLGPVSSTTISVGANCCRRPAPAGHGQKTRPGKPVEAAVSQGLRIFGWLGSTMPGWWALKRTPTAADRGAYRSEPRTKVVRSAGAEGDLWAIPAGRRGRRGKAEEVKARLLVNAARSVGRPCFCPRPSA